MPRCRFVQPSIVRLPISEGDWIDVKRDLSYGEEREMFAAMRSETATGELRVDARLVGPARLLAYLLAWSFTGPDGQPVEVSAGAIDQLDRGTAAELFVVLDTHDETVRRARTALATFPAGEAVSSPTSPSAV